MAYARHTDASSVVDRAQASVPRVGADVPVDAFRRLSVQPTSPARRQPQRTVQGFTLLEVLAVIMVIGLLSTLVVGGFTNVVPAGREAAAVNKARIVNAARITYALTVPDSATQWSNTLTDSDRSALLVNAGVLSGSSTDWLTATGGYTLGLSGALKSKTVLKDGRGATLNYPD